MRKIDIRPLKQKLRGEIKEWRKSLSPESKGQADRRILDRLRSLREYEGCETVLAYVSLPIEVDTLNLIQAAWQDGKKVAAPRCVPGTRDMEFFLISSFEQLEPQTFGVMEPVPHKCEKLVQFHNSICIVPALAYDRQGYRLGYGAGYYDRFLSGYPGEKIGIVYQENMRQHLWHGKYDVQVDLIITEKRLWSIKRQH